MATCRVRGNDAVHPMGLLNEHPVRSMRSGCRHCHSNAALTSARLIKDGIKELN